MPDPVRAWAAVAPARRQIDETTVRSSAQASRRVVASIFSRDAFDPIDLAWRRAYRAGWRVVPVKIVPMEGDGGE